MRRLWFFLALVLLALPSCSHREKVRKPEVFLEEHQMIDVMTDAYLIEAMLNQKKTDATDITELQAAYYNQLFEHYGITDSIFEENIRYYTHHPDVLERIMDSVTNRFAKAQQ